MRRFTFARGRIYGEGQTNATCMQYAYIHIHVYNILCDYVGFSLYIRNPIGVERGDWSCEGILASVCESL